MEKIRGKSQFCSQDGMGSIPTMLLDTLGFGHSIDWALRWQIPAALKLETPVTKNVRSIIVV